MEGHSRLMKKVYWSIAAWDSERGCWAQSSTMARDDEEGIRRAKIQFPEPRWQHHCGWETGKHGFVVLRDPDDQWDNFFADVLWDNFMEEVYDDEWGEFDDDDWAS